MRADTSIEGWTPPLNEQLQIVEWLTARIGHCDELVAEASRAIDLLQNAVQPSSPLP